MKAVTTVLFVSLFSTLSLFTSVGYALQPSQQKSYYGPDFYETVLEKHKDEPLKNALKVILKSGHVKNPSGPDKLVPSCDGQRNCRIQTSIGYNGARTFLLGKFYLVKNGSGWGIQEMYCDRVYAGTDFRGQQPGPGIIPDNTIINVEHTWPQSRFSGKFPKDLQKADLHHLYPTDSVMNSLRGNMIFGEVTQDSQKAKCHASKHGTGSGGGREIFEPPQNHKGHVARSLFYFSIRYDIAIDPREEVILKKWHQENPVDAIETARNEEIYNVQFNRNPFIDHPELVSAISDF